MVSTTWIRLSCFLCLSCSAVVARHHPRQANLRFKRIINVTDVKEISIEEHDKNYPFIVGVKTEQHVFDGKVIKKMVRCTGTMLSSQLVLTTGYCVRNAIMIKVYKHDNPLERKSNETSVEVKLRSILDANEFDKTTDLRQFPNPLFYGDMINRYHKWYSMFLRDDDRMANLPIRNLAMVYLEEPLHSDDKITINYPTIVANPSNFVGRNRTANLFGWCQMGILNETTVKNGSISKNITQHTRPPIIRVYNKPRLTMATVQVSVCEIDKIYANNLCIDKNKYKDAFCELDQGGPLILQDGKDGESNKPSKGKLQMTKMMVPRVTTETNRPSSKTTFKITTAETWVLRQGKDGAPSSQPPVDKPLMTTQPKSDKLPSPSLIGMVNTHKTHGHLTYLWPYADWIYSVMEEYGVRPTAQPTCLPTTTEYLLDDKITTIKLRIESYYDYLGEHGDSKQVRSVDIPCGAPIVVPAVPCLIAVNVVLSLRR